MAFVRKKVKTFKWPVTVAEPSSERPGEFQESTFTAVFNRVKMSQLEEMAETSGVSFLSKVLVGWEGIEDEDGSELKFSKSALEEFADDADWTRAVLSAYTATYAEAEAKN
jgi:hypothetical protein